MSMETAVFAQPSPAENVESHFGHFRFAICTSMPGGTRYVHSDTFVLAGHYAPIAVPERASVIGPRLGLAFVRRLTFNHKQKCRSTWSSAGLVSSTCPRISALRGCMLIQYL